MGEMTEDEVQACMEEGDLCTATHARGLAMAYALGRRAAIAELIAELREMPPSIDANQAATDFAQTYASELATERQGKDGSPSR